LIKTRAKEIERKKRAKEGKKEKEQHLLSLSPPQNEGERRKQQVKRRG